MSGAFQAIDRRRVATVVQKGRLARADHPDASLDIVEPDLGSLASVATAALLSHLLPIVVAAPGAGW